MVGLVPTCPIFLCPDADTCLVDMKGPFACCDCSSASCSSCRSAPTAWSATFYASPGGSDSGTGAARCTRAQTASTPLLTINIALACAGGGDTVQLGAGMFVPRQRIDLNQSTDSTTRTTYLTLQGAKALGPTVTNKTGATILDGTGLGDLWMVYGRHVHYTKIRNLELRNYVGGGIGLFGNTTRVEVTDNYIHDNTFSSGAGSAIRPTARYSPTFNTGQGSEMGVASYVTVARNDIRRIRTGFMGDLPYSGSETLTVAGNISHFLIEDNYIEAGQFIGIDMIGKSNAWWEVCNDRPDRPLCFPTLPITGETWPHQGIIRRNTVTALRKGLGAADVGIYCDACRDVVIERNLIDGTAGYCIFMGTEEDGFLLSHILIRHNIGMHCPTAIFGLGPATRTTDPTHHGDSEHMRVVHNTGLKTKNTSPVLRLQRMTGGQVKNNIAAVISSDNAAYVWHKAGDPAPLIDYTLYWGSIEPDSWQYNGLTNFTFPTWQAGSHQDAHGMLADPQFTNATAKNLSLKAGSPALDAGGDLTLTASAGSGTVVPVLDARYFTAGHGMVSGDPIQIGVQVTRVTAVNYALNQLTVAAPLTWGAGVGVNYPFRGTRPDIGACEGVGLCTAVPVPDEPIIEEPEEPELPPAPAVALELTHTCATASNALGARVMGSLVYLPPGASYGADTLARSQCASTVSLTDSASVLGSLGALFPPWRFLGTAGPNVGNTCTNCLSVHAGTPSVLDAGAGYTLSGFREGGTVSAATGGESAFTALPGLCHQVVDGAVTTTPLWPWPMEARIAAARSLAGALPVAVTNTVEATLGPILPVCKGEVPGEPQTVWFLAPAGVDGAACSLAAPCATLAHVGGRMSSGHTLYLRAGTYAQAITPGLMPGGTSWTTPTMIVAYEGEAVVLQQTAGALAAFTAPATDRFVLLRGLTLDGGGVSATTSQGLVVGPGAGPVRFQAGTIRGTALERVLIDGGTGG